MKREKIRKEVIRCKTNGERCNTYSAVHERTVGRTCSQNEQHQVGQDNIRVDTQRRKMSRRRPKWRWRDNIEKVGSGEWMRVAQDKSARVVEAICQQWREWLRRRRRIVSYGSLGIWIMCDKTLNC